MQWMIWIWLAVICASLIFEFVSPTMTSIWFAIGALVSLILSACKVDILWQVVVFVIISLVFLLSFRKLALKFLYKNNDEKTNTSAFIGKEYILLEEITILNRGTVKIDGVLWSCISANLDENIPAGTVVIVQEIKGNKLDTESFEYGVGWTSNTNQEFYFDLDDENIVRQHTWCACTDRFGYTRVETNIKVDGKYKTSDEKVYAVGDLIGTKQTVAWAARSGFECAKQICNLT